MNQTEEPLERRVGPLEQAALGLAETKERTSRIESDVTSLRVAMADGNAKLEEVRREVAGQKAQLSDCCPKVKKDLTDLQQELATLKEEMRATKAKAEPLAPPTADVTVPAAPPSSALAKPAPKLARVKVSPPPAPPKRGR
jgi:chromosome segregation ATPase